MPDSYGYRPNKSALDAIEVTRKRCWQYDWVLEFDIRGLFDNIDHTLLLRAVRKHVKCEWALLYIERWLKAPMELEDGTRVERTKRHSSRRCCQSGAGKSCSCTTRLMRGWRESTRTSHGAGMQMMDWYTAGRKPKP